MSNLGHHDCSKKAVFLCTADKLQCWPMLARWNLHAQPAPPFIQHSFEQRLQLFYQVFSFENNPWAGLGRILRCLRNHRKTLMSTKACYCGKVSLYRLWNNSLASALGGACAMGTNTMSKFRPSWLFQKGCFSLHNCQTAILPHVGTLNSPCWALHLSISIHLSNTFSCSMKFFLGLGLGESCVAWATTAKHWCPQRHFLCTADKLQCWPMLARWTQHAGPSTFQSAFIWAIALVVLWNSFLGWPWANLALLPQRQKNTDVRCLLFPISVRRLS